MLPQEDKNLTLKRELIEGTIETVAAIGLEIPPQTPFAQPAT